MATPETDEIKRARQEAYAQWKEKGTLLLLLKLLEDESGGRRSVLKLALSFIDLYNQKWRENGEFSELEEKAWELVTSLIGALENEGVVLIIDQGLVIFSPEVHFSPEALPAGASVVVVQPGIIHNSKVVRKALVKKAE